MIGAPIDTFGATRPVDLKTAFVRQNEFKGTRIFSDLAVFVGSFSRAFQRHGSQVRQLAFQDDEVTGAAHASRRARS